MEETGLKALDPREITHFDPLPGYIRPRAHVVACDFEAEPRMPVSGEAGLREVNIVTIQDARRVVRRGEIDEMQAACATLFFCATR